MIEYTLINTNEELEQKCKKLKNEKRIAMDIEADSMHHYKEKVCLVQIADSSEHLLIDPLKMESLSALKPFCEAPEITKVFHGADFDIRSLDRDFNIRINNLFDTEIACRFLGIQKRSLAALLKKHFNLCLDKRFQKTDWSRRPLSDEMIAYSINDVAHLIELSEILENKLKERNRLAWAQEEFELQTKVRYDNNGNEPLFLKFKGAGKMEKQSLAVLESLLQMRKKIGKEKNLPLFKIMSAESIINMTNDKPLSMNALKNIKALSVKQMGMYGEQCIEAIKQGMAIPKKNLPSYPRKKAPSLSPEIPKRIKALKEMRVNLSKKTGIEPGFLINNAMITAIAAATPATEEELKKINGTRNWQMEILGREIINILRMCQ